MCLIRGVNGLCPCPWCLVPKEMQSNLSAKYPSRDIGDVQPIVENEQLSFSAKDDLLKSKSYRPISVSFDHNIFIYFTKLYIRMFSGNYLMQVHMS